ncbi:MAG: tetratricopeptide repeat protein [Candidatus Brocadiaceae bacterium]|nr:tetratricopeptide repeat protein [Candidatus Brocadiaceae bacterium]
MLQTIIKLRLKTVYLCIAVLITGTICLGYGIDNIFAASGSLEPEKVLGVDDSESIPALGGAEKPFISSSAEKSTSESDITSDFNIGVYYQKQGDLVKAIDAYEKVLRVDPDNAEAHNNLGIIYKEQGELDKAVEHFQRVVSLNPGMDEAHNNLGVMYYLSKDQRNAVVEYRKAFEINPQNVTSQINLGLVYKAQGLERQSIEMIEEVLTVEPFNLEAHYNLGTLYEGLGHLEKAVWHYSRFNDNVGKSYPVLKGKVLERIDSLEIISGELLGSRDRKVIGKMEK